MNDIVIVTRDADVSRVLTRALEKDGYTVITAPTVKEFLVNPRGKKPRLIVFDIQPPVGETFEDCKRVKADPSMRDVPLITLFNVAWERERREVFEHTCADTLLHKPFSLKEFRKTVYSWV